MKFIVKSKITGSRLRRVIERSGVVFVLVLFLLSFGAVFGDILGPHSVSALTAVDPLTIAACGGNPECFAFTIDTRLVATGVTTGTATTFSIPVSGIVGGSSNTYSWLVDWGDGSAVQSVVSSGTSHDYATTGGAGQYQITIRPNGAATMGWMNAFGFSSGPSSSSGANTDANKYMFRSIDTPFTNLMKTEGAIYRFANVFYNTRNATGIPDNLFANISTTGTTNFSYMFLNTFAGLGRNSTTVTIPTDLFDFLDTSSGTNFSGMFSGTFSSAGSGSLCNNTFGYASTIASIPVGLFDPIDTRNGTDFSNMFDSTFSCYAYRSTTGTIPAGLFDSINTSNGTGFGAMFYRTFSNYARSSTVGTIPAGLFDSIDTSNGTSFYTSLSGGMFYGTFSAYAYNSTIGTIPAGLFDSINTSNGVNLQSMFNYTFSNYANSSTSGTIPAGLFDSIDTGSGINFENMFSGTFSRYAYYSTIGTIPAGLFDSINTSNGTYFRDMFNSTFSYYAYNSTVGTIPLGLFDFLDTNSGDTSNSLTFSYMFNGTFNAYAIRTARFIVGGSVVDTQTFAAGPYSMKNTSTDNTPSTNPVVNAGDVVVPTYDSVVRTIAAPTGAYAGYDWYRTDGTSCAALVPTPNCGAQTTDKLVSFPNTSEWVPETSTEYSNVTFYGVASSMPVTVTFDSNDGSVVADQTINAGSVIDRPIDPIKAGYTFAGWFVDPALTTLWNFATDIINEDIILYADWTLIPVPPGPITPIIPGVPNVGVGLFE
ncbi:InlB B-repeat-containing protein [Candidatus Saccharibacteria bacterium]|nr:InlB B-repeat-containing protein [Candidatus Saccharibacteria bacterium]